MKCRKWPRKFKIKHSIIHGLSGFLVLCYARTTLVTLLILKPGRLHGKGYTGGEQVVFYQGNLDYFSRGHWKYAIPALVALVLMTILPPILLLVYPLCYKVLAVVRLEESKITKLLCKAIPLEKFKPLFDSFQGEFRDSHRYFAGLYFIYRLLALTIFAFANTLTEFYFFLELLLILMLALHAWCQPYKKRWHNRLDMYIFTILIIINRMTQKNYQESLDLYKDKYINAHAVSTFQILLAYTPLVYIVVYSLNRMKIIKYIRNKFTKNKEENSMEMSLSLMEEQRDRVSSNSYHKFN